MQYLKRADIHDAMFTRPMLTPYFQLVDHLIAQHPIHHVGSRLNAASTTHADKRVRLSGSAGGPAHTHTTCRTIKSLGMPLRLGASKVTVRVTGRTGPVTVPGFASVGHTTCGHRPRITSRCTPPESRRGRRSRPGKPIHTARR